MVQALNIYCRKHLKLCIIQVLGSFNQAVFTNQTITTKMHRIMEFSSYFASSKRDFPNWFRLIVEPMHINYHNIPFFKMIYLHVLKSDAECSMLMLLSFKHVYSDKTEI